jgi:uncharacterized membrane protein YeaQ/YmgE (transglycosylase-associated protein family)
MGIVIWIIVGAIAGFVASKVLTGKGMGLLWDTGTFTVSGLLAAFVGAVILLVVFRALTHRGMIRSRN